MKNDQKTIYGPSLVKIASNQGCPQLLIELVHGGSSSIQLEFFLYISVII